MTITHGMLCGQMPPLAATLPRCLSHSYPLSQLVVVSVSDTQGSPPLAAFCWHKQASCESITPCFP